MAGYDRHVRFRADSCVRIQMTTTSTRPTEIERLERPARKLFEREYVNRNRPVILTGVASAWPAMTKWTPDYLKAVGGDEQIQVRYEESGDFHRYYLREVPAAERRMTFAQYLDLLTGDPPDTRHYMAENLLGGISSELLSDVDCREYVLRGPPRPRFFLGQDSYSCMHYHGHGEALLCQLVGTKEITLFAPEAASKLYANPWWCSLVNFSQVDVRAPDLDRFPRFREATPIKLSLRAGEILFIPVHWWHAIDSPGFSVAAVFFWRARWRHFQFPQPAIPICLHTMLAPVSLRANAIYSYRWLRRVFRLRTRFGAVKRRLFGV